MKHNNLNNIISNIRGYISSKKLSSENVRRETEKLKEEGFEYNHELYPALKGTRSFEASKSDSPLSLAEALLWKLGKWKSYEKFRRQFEKAEPKIKNDAVFFAFARHLCDPDSNPIFDQHTLRAMLAVNSKLNKSEIEKIKESLLSKEGSWRESMTGRHVADCYNLYCDFIQGVTVAGGASLKEVDQLLMPLGQAIKKSSTNLTSFYELTGIKNG